MKNLSKLIKKALTDKSGGRRTVWVKEQKEIPLADHNGIIHPDKIFHNKVKQQTIEDLTSFFKKKLKVGKEQNIPLEKRKDLWDGSRIKDVEVKNIVPCQDYINNDVLNKYIKDRGGDIPLGVKVPKSKKVILFDGHHRVASDILNGEKISKMDLVNGTGFKHYQDKK